MAINSRTKKTTPVKTTVAESQPKVEAGEKLGLAEAAVKSPAEEVAGWTEAEGDEDDPEEEDEEGEEEEDDEEDEEEDGPGFMGGEDNDPEDADLREMAELAAEEDCLKGIIRDLRRMRSRVVKGELSVNTETELLDKFTLLIRETRDPKDWVSRIHRARPSGTPSEITDRAHAGNAPQTRLHRPSGGALESLRQSPSGLVWSDRHCGAVPVAALPHTGSTVYEQQRSVGPHQEVPRGKAQGGCAALAGIRRRIHRRWLGRNQQQDAARVSVGEGH